MDGDGGREVERKEGRNMVMDVRGERDEEVEEGGQTTGEGQSVEGRLLIPNMRLKKKKHVASNWLLNIPP